MCCTRRAGHAAGAGPEYLSRISCGLVASDDVPGSSEEMEETSEAPRENPARTVDAGQSTTELLISPRCVYPGSDRSHLVLTADESPPSAAPQAVHSPRHGSACSQLHTPNCSTLVAARRRGREHSSSYRMPDATDTSAPIAADRQGASRQSRAQVEASHPGARILDGPSCPQGVIRRKRS